jgi:hypothetical protein
VRHPSHQMLPRVLENMHQLFHMSLLTKNHKDVVANNRQSGRRRTGDKKVIYWIFVRLK